MVVGILQQIVSFLPTELLTSEGGNLLQSVQLAQLNDTDIRSLIDTLIAKLSSADLAKTFDWSKVRTQVRLSFSRCI